VLLSEGIVSNQADNEEKKIQTPLMGDIYGFAKRVLAWLGDIPTGESVDVEKIELIGAMVANESINRHD
jgi:Heterokaryon incompatibility protein (HET)